MASRIGAMPVKTGEKMERNQEIMQFLDEISTINHNESRETLLVWNYGMNYKTAEEYVLTWLVERA